MYTIHNSIKIFTPKLVKIVNGNYFQLFNTSKHNMISHIKPKSIQINVVVAL